MLRFDERTDKLLSDMTTDDHFALMQNMLQFCDTFRWNVSEMKRVVEGNALA